MRKIKIILAATAAALLATAMAPVLAHDSDEKPNSMTKGGMMGGRNMMGQANGMMGCGSMMQGNRGGSRPNDQWRKDAPAAPSDKDG